MIVKHSKEKFCETFVNKGWNQVIYAIMSKHKDGLLLDYSIKKRKIFFSIRSSIDTGALTNLIAAGLSDFFLNKNDEEIRSLGQNKP